MGLGNFRTESRRFRMSRRVRPGRPAGYTCLLAFRAIVACAGAADPAGFARRLHLLSA
jgi:hypothetical protein